MKRWWDGSSSMYWGERMWRHCRTLQGGVWEEAAEARSRSGWLLRGPCWSSAGRICGAREGGERVHEEPLGGAMLRLRQQLALAASGRRRAGPGGAAALGPAARPVSGPVSPLPGPLCHCRCPEEHAAGRPLCKTARIRAGLPLPTPVSAPSCI